MHQEKKENKYPVNEPKLKELKTSVSLIHSRPASFVGIGSTNCRRAEPSHEPGTSTDIFCTVGIKYNASCQDQAHTLAAATAASSTDSISTTDI